MPKVVGILAKKGSKEILTEARKIHKIIEQHGFRSVPDEEIGRSAKIAGGKPLRRMEIELLVTLGGDGTVLKAAKEMLKPKTPILAVNMGRRAYPTKVEPSECETAFTKWEKSNCALEDQWKISVLHTTQSVGAALQEAS